MHPGRNLFLGVVTTATCSWAAAQSPLRPQEPLPPRAPTKALTSPPSLSRPPAVSQSPPARLPDSLVQTEPPLSVERTKFTPLDPQAVEVRRHGRSWELWSGKSRLKDFGDDRQAAFQARRLIAELRLTEYAAIGTNGTVLEVWLSDGQPPSLPTFSRNIIPFDPDSLRVIEDRGQFLVGNDRQIFFNFGPHPDDAHRALALIQQYGFNELGFLGEPTPRMSYLLKNPTARRPVAAPQAHRLAALPQMTVRHPFELPGFGQVGELFVIDPIKLETRQAPDGWHLFSGPHDLGIVAANEYQARTAMQIVQRYPLTEQIRLGNDGFAIYLCHGAAPKGTPLGSRRIPFQLDSLTVKTVSNQAILTDGRRTLATFSSPDDAQRTLSVMKHYGLNAICEIGSRFQLLVKD